MQQTPEDSQNPQSLKFRQLLQTEFVKRCKRNPAYSMRAFAKFLEVDQSLLSKIMRHQRGVSKENILKMGTKLGLSPSKIKALAKNQDYTPTTEFATLSDDEFSLISDWSNFAILELSKTKSFEPNEVHIAKRLGLHVDEARAALERLHRLGYIQEQKGSWRIQFRNHTWTNNQATTEARRLLQKNLLEKSVQAIDTVPFELRDNGSLTVAIDKNRLPEFKEKLRQFRQELGSFFQPDEKDLSEVYQLTVSLFPLTKIKGDLK